MNEDYFTCLFCNTNSTINKDTFMTKNISFYGFNYPVAFHESVDNRDRSDEIKISFYKCSRCKEISIISEGIGNKVEGIITNIYPKSSAKKFPNYVPKQIRNDYEEAYSIVNLSPKASATLARRALQGMIRHFFGVKKSRLIDEIEDISDKVTPADKSVLDSIRQIGNIGAHPERDINTIVDIEPNEANKILKAIEYFIKFWYIDRHERELLFSDLQTITGNISNQKVKKK